MIRIDGTQNTELKLEHNYKKFLPSQIKIKIQNRIFAYFLAYFTDKIKVLVKINQSNTDIQWLLAE